MFQVVPPCGGHLGEEPVEEIEVMFQVVPPCGGHRRPGSRVRRPPVVSSRAPVWGASLALRHAALGVDVSSRAPVWGASFLPGKAARSTDVSSGAPVWGASSPFTEPVRRSDVSSRAPVWGASEDEAALAQVLAVSSRAPVWGASRREPIRHQAGRFKSCPRVGGIAGFGVKSEIVWVSSRAPVWGASRQIFNIFPRFSFQVVPPCGGHPLCLSKGDAPNEGFKSCPRVGGIPCRCLLTRRP